MTDVLVIGAIVIVALAPLWITLIAHSLPLFQRFCCKLGWHSHPNFEYTEHDGASQHVKCRWCGYEGMIDSQGNLF